MTLDEYLSSNKISEAAFGKRIAVSQQSVHRYRKRSRQPGPQIAQKIEAATEGAVRKETLRPDIWGAA